MGRASRNKKQRRHRSHWHGGHAGLGVGELILPPSQHPAEAAVYEDGRRRNAWGYAAPSDLVFVTSSRDMALSYARNLLGPGGTTGWVYRVMPLSTPAEDPDFAGRDVSFQCFAARIIAVEETDLSHLTLQDARRLVGPYMAWTDGSDVYDSEGYVIPDARMRQFGYTRENLRARFGRWPDIGHISRILTAESRARFLQSR